MTFLRFLVSDLIDRPGERRIVSGSLPVDLRIGDSVVDGPVEVEAVIEGIDGGVLARFEAAFSAQLECTRCLTTWDEPIRVTAVQVFESEPDEDGYAIAHDDTIDLGGPVRDEVALGLPLRPLCRPDCLGLCPTCGTDLNRDPCGGHEEVSESPFDALRGLFDEDSSEQESSDRDLSQP